MAQATGNVIATGDGAFDLVLTRTFDAPPAEVWASLTDPTRTAMWLGPWRGEAGVGQDIELQMAFEEGDEWSAVRIDACDPPQRIAVTVSNETGGWALEASVAEGDAGTALTFVHHLDDPALAEFTGPGWEYYLDNLVAVRAGIPLPDFADYYPAQAEYYLDAVRRAQD
ncbi:MAG: SRPBCC family protein [Mycetocola sp.]